MKIVLIVVAVVVGLIALVALIGALLPKDHVASRSTLIRRDAQSVYAAVRDVGNAPSWRSGLERVELLGPTRFREFGKDGAITYDIVTDEPPRKLITRIADTNLGFGGSWTYTFDQIPEGTRVTITENGVVSNVIFRFMMRFVFGTTSTIDKYLAALENHMK